METQKPIYEIHALHTEWLNKLSFYADDLKVMQKRIEEVVAKNTDKAVLAKIDHFQNQLIIQKEQIDILRHDINANESLVEKNILANETAVDHRKMPADSVNAEKVEIFEKIFNELRKELLGFLAKWM